MPFDATCPLCEGTAKFDPVGFLSPKRHYKCECAEFVVDEHGAKTLAIYGKENNRGLIEAARATPPERICVINVTTTVGLVDILLDRVLRSEAFR